MVYRVVEHTADLGIEVESETLDGLFAEAARGLTDCVTEVGRVEPRLSREIAVEADELSLLLVDWLGEVLFRFETEEFVAARATARVSQTATGWLATGVLDGERHDPGRHPHKVALKAVTYHGLVVEERPEVWFARVIFDI